jgi:hypothetical protein
MTLCRYTSVPARQTRAAGGASDARGWCAKRRTVVRLMRNDPRMDRSSSIVGARVVRPNASGALPAQVESEATSEGPNTIHDRRLFDARESRRPKPRRGAGGSRKT